MKTSAAGLDFIKANEGSSLTPYKDVAGKWTIGVGHLIVPPESYPNGITEEEEMALLVKDVGKVEATLNTLIPPECTQDQFDALCDFGFNLGTGALKTMMGHGWDQIPMQILRWDKARVGPDLVVVAGLTRRRERELALFTS